MEKYIIHAGIIAFVYLLIKFAEMRVITKEPKPLKEMLRDTVIVYLSSVVGLYIITELMPAASIKNETMNVFVDAPGF
jgi:hypothetical protein